MIFSTKDAYKAGKIDHNPSWLPDMFKCRGCDKIFFVTMEYQKDKELCHKCNKGRTL